MRRTIVLALALMMALAALVFVIVSARSGTDAHVERCRQTAGVALLQLRAWTDNRLAIQDATARQSGAGESFDRVGNVLVACYGADVRAWRVAFTAALESGSKPRANAVLDQMRGSIKP